MRVLLASALLCAVALTSAAEAQAYGPRRAGRHHATHTQTADPSWRDQRAYAPSAATSWHEETHTRGEGGANWDPGSANGS